MGKDNIIEEVKALFGGIPENFNILEDEIDVQLQLEYFDFAKKHRKALDEGGDQNETQNLIDELESSDTEISRKKTLLVELASLSEVEALRAVEKYKTSPDEELIDWSKLAFQESKMHVEHDLLDEKQVFISTGLGGKDGKLRFCIALKHEENETFTEVQQRVVRNEIVFAIENAEGVFETIDFGDEYAIAKVLMPLNSDLQNILRNAVEECNSLGKFLSENIVITNVKHLTVDDIRQIEQQEREKEEQKKDSISIEIKGDAKTVAEELRKALEQLIKKRPKNENEEQDEEPTEEDE